jgi:hypothetical protein
VFNLHFLEDEQRLKWRVANIFWHDYNHNTTHEKRKARALDWALALFVTQTLLLVAALSLVAFSSESDRTHRSQCPALAVRGEQALAPEGLERRECRAVPADFLRSSTQDPNA